MRYSLLSVLAVIASLTIAQPAVADTDWSKQTDYQAHLIPTSYRGQPDLGLTLAMVTAGGGPTHFTSAALIKVLAGPSFDAEVRSLVARFGKKRVDAFLATFTFAVNDAVTVATSENFTLPDKPSVDPTDGKALAGALYAAGTPPGGSYDPGYMLEHLISHAVHLRVMHDVDANAAYGMHTDGDFHVVLTQAMSDLKAAYKF